ncbi:hypothetical protein [Pseudomonas sp. NA-150]|uniref:hypothetical protein n=1 Tax=Pseudomonas sp. NA-150 TaxID=3367525 RepID=UPI0037C94EA2
MIFSNPFQRVREAVTLLEDGINALAARKMESKQFAQAASQIARVSLGVRHVFEKTLACSFKRLDIPSRRDLFELNSLVRRVEDKLDHLLPPHAVPSLAPRPARTRRPPEPPAKVALKPATKRKVKEVKDDALPS